MWQVFEATVRYFCDHTHVSTCKCRETRGRKPPIDKKRNTNNTSFTQFYTITLFLSRKRTDCSVPFRSVPFQSFRIFCKFIDFLCVHSSAHNKHFIITLNDIALPIAICDAFFVRMCVCFQNDPTTTYLCNCSTVRRYTFEKMKK